MLKQAKKIGLLLNSQAKKTQRYPLLVQKIIDEFPQPSHVWRPENLEELSKVAKKILDEQFDFLFIFGGDGTFRTTVEYLLRQKSDAPLPGFVVLQGGTANLYSMHLHGRRHPLKLMRKALQIIESETVPTRTINILRVNDHYGFIFAMGGMANFINYYLTYRKRSISLGLWISLKIVVSFIFRTSLYRRLFPQIRLEISKDEQVKTLLDCTGISCASIEGYFLRPYIDIKTNLQFSILTFHKSPITLFRWLPSMMMGEKFRSRSVEQTHAKILEIISPDPLQPMLDGDMLPKTRHMVVELGPEIKILLVRS